jgi:hypothetical protein
MDGKEMLRSEKYFAGTIGHLSHPRRSLRETAPGAKIRLM